MPPGGPSTASAPTSNYPGGSGGSGGGGRGRVRNSSRGGGGGGGGGGYGKLVDSLREVCPTHKQSDLDKLVRSLKGDEEKIREQIAAWWDEPVEPAEAEWEDVHKRESKNKQMLSHPPGGRPGGPGRYQGGGRGGRGERGGGRGDRPARGEGGRGGRDGGRGRGRNGGHDKKASETPAGQSTAQDSQAKPEAVPEPGVPSIGSAKALQGAWAKKSEPAPSAAPPVPAAEAPSVSVAAPTLLPAPVAPPQPIAAPVVAPVAPPSKEKKAPTPTGNVWATRGSAHLIQAEKPKPPTPPAPPKQASPPKQPQVAPAPPKQPQIAPIAAPQSSPAASMLIATEASIVPPPPQSLGPPAAHQSAVVAPPAPVAPVHPPTSAAKSRGGGGAWKQPSPKVVSQPPAPTIDMPPLPVSVIGEASSTSAVASAPPPPVSKAKQASSVLNMGHWETSESDENNLDFGFGSFGTADDVVIDAGSSAAAVQPPSSNEASEATVPSPARPPPGLSISGMPPIPANAVLVHELEDKLEGTSLNPKPPTAPSNLVGPDKPNVGGHMSMPGPAGPQHMDTSALHHPPQAAAAAYNYGMGMYSYGANAGAPGNAFMGGIPAPTAPSAPVLSAGLPGQVPKVDHSQQPPSSVSSLPSTGLYGTGGPQSAPSSGNAPPPPTSSNPPSTDASAAAAGMPPGMPGMYNPMYYGQQPYHMGQHQGNLGYNYGYGAQFGGAVQGGFGYHQMGQSGAYGHQPHYDDQGTGGGGGGYQKNTGYRGRNSHHSSNQYQSQYNPQQHGGYGGQPYGMGYHGGHDFNQRSYGGMQDPYGMQQQPPQQQQPGVGFQDDYKNKKGGRGGGLGQFQPQPPQGPPPQLGGQHQPFGLHGGPGGGTSDASQPTGTSGGWSNQQTSTSGWNGGAPSWQGK